MNTVKVAASKVRAIIGKGAPDFKGRFVTIVFNESVFLSHLNWDGGVKTEWSVVQADFSSTTVPVLAPWENHLEGAKITLDPATLVVAHHFTWGKESCSIHAHPSLAPKWLPA